MNVTLVQNKAENGFEIGCSTNSGCQQSFVDFFAEINKVSSRCSMSQLCRKKLFFIHRLYFAFFVFTFDKVFVGAFEFGKLRED